VTLSSRESHARSYRGQLPTLESLNLNPLRHPEFLARLPRDRPLGGGSRVHRAATGVTVTAAGTSTRKCNGIATVVSPREGNRRTLFSLSLFLFLYQSSRLEGSSRIAVAEIPDRCKAQKQKQDTMKQRFFRLPLMQTSPEHRGDNIKLQRVFDSVACYRYRDSFRPSFVFEKKCNSQG